jgi:TonB family protein
MRTSHLAIPSQLKPVSPFIYGKRAYAMKPLTLALPRWPSPSSPKDVTVRNETLSIAFLISLAIHISVMLTGAVVVRKHDSRPKELLWVNLIDAPRHQVPPPPQKMDARSKIKEKVPPPSKQEKPKELATAAKASLTKPELIQKPLPTVPAKDEPVTAETSPNLSSTSRVEGGGSEAGIGSLFGKGDVGVTPRPGTAGGGGGTAASGLGRGAGAPGLPAQSVLRTNREAKPTQTVRANYPPMALRAGLESDVILKIEVDAQGNVTNAEITKSGGSGFDEEALKAVKQSRFEPAQRDGHNVAAEFTYIYRFRLQR